MANDNHEQYDGNDISTYTDVINNLNMMTPDFIDGCTLSAGLLPCDNPKIQVTSQQPFEQGPNSLSPFYFDGGGNLWFDETELSDATDSRFQYLHIVYSGISDNQIASSLKVQNYRNFVTISQHTETINGTPYSYYELGLTTKYGDNDDPDSTWTNSVLKPMYVIPDNNMRTGFFAEEIMCVQECDFGSGGTHGKVCTNLNYQQGRRNLIDGSGTFVEKAIWFAGLGLPQGYHINGGTQYGSDFDHHLQWQNNPSGFYAGSVINNEDDLLMLTAICGLKFEYNNTLYKPIVEGGVVTGYTSDMSETSEWDSWEDIGDHEIPIDPHPVPPVPTGDDIDANSFGGGSKLGGVDNLWLLTAQQLADLHTAMNNNNDPNFEPLNSIISVLGLAISPLYIFGDDISTLTNISIKKADGTSWSSGVNGHICSSQVSSFGLTGNISIKRKYNNFLDYPPYASHEIFLPLCGWIPLPACCVGRNLSVYYVPDIQTGGVRGLVLCDGCIVGEKYGILGANIPFTSNGHGLMLGGIISGGVQTLADFATAMGGLATGNAMATVYGGSSFFSDGFNMALAANQNRTSVIGQNQDRTGFSDGTFIRIKSIYQDVKIDPLFGHTIGYLCHESGLLSDFHGFTVCENPHVHISATSAEKEEIKRLLEDGVILPEGE